MKWYVIPIRATFSCKPSFIHEKHALDGFILGFMVEFDEQQLEEYMYNCVLHHRQSCAGKK
jgi:hypothetical protein